jgi:hypothetical protein
MSMSKSMPYYVTGLQTWAWAAVEHLLDGDNHPDGTPVWALTPTVSTSRDHTGGWTVTVTITTTDDEPLPCFPSSWSVSAVPARNGVVTVFRSMLDQRHAGNHETFTAWSEMLAELFDAWKRALSDGQPAAIEEAPASIETFRRVLNAPEPEADEADVRAVRSATNARSAIRWADRLIADWQRDRDTDRPQMSDNMSVEAAALRAWAKAPVGTAHVLRFGAPLTVVALAKSYNAAGDDDGLVAELVALAERLADRINSAMAGVAGPAS